MLSAMNRHASGKLSRQGFILVAQLHCMLPVHRDCVHNFFPFRLKRSLILAGSPSFWFIHIVSEDTKVICGPPL